MRKSPVRHRVKNHTRRNGQIQVHSYPRGHKKPVLIVKKRKVPKTIRSLLKNLPKNDRNLYSKVYIGEEHPRYGKSSGLWLAKSLPGGELWLRWVPRKESDKITVFHEYGHYVWYFSLTDEQRQISKRAYNKAEQWAKKEAIKRKGERIYYPYKSWQEYELAGRAGRNEKEAFAEAYAWYYASKEMRKILKNKRSEMFKALKRIESERVRNEA